MKSTFLNICALAVVLISCDRYPQDPHRTLEKVMNDTLRVGISESGRWASYRDGKPSGRDVEVVQGFAGSIGATIEWVPGNQEQVMDLLKEYRVHLAVGGFTRGSVWKKEAALTQPYFTERIKLAALGEAHLPPDADDVEGRKVYVEEGSDAAIAVRKKGGRLQLLGSATPSHGLLAAPEGDLRAMRVPASDYDLMEEKHVVAVPRGENALLGKLDEYIFSHVRQQK